MRICFLSIDVEKKDESGSFEGIEKLDGMLDIFKKHKVNATLFVTGEVLERYSHLIKKWGQDYEIGCHNYYHTTLDKLEIVEREKQIKNFVELYKKILDRNVKGFRAPRNIIDNEQFPILQAHGFLYDASIFPRYPWWKKKYAGYKGKKPVLPYWLKNELLEIPESPAGFSIPLVGTWIRGLGVKFYKILFLFRKPKFISFNMHSWDCVEKKYIRQLDEILTFLKKLGYKFKSGEEIYNEISNSPN